MSVPKKQHFVPQAYLKKWEDNDHLLWVYDLSKSTFYHKSKKSVFTGDYLYSITIRELSLLSKQEKELFAVPLNDYQVFLDGKKLDNAEIVENLVRYKDFAIHKNNGMKVSPNHKEALIDEVFNQKHPMIETSFGPIETSWPSTVDFFENWRTAILNHETIHLDYSEVKVKCRSLLNFIFATYTRNPYSILRSMKRFEETTSSEVSLEEKRYVFEKIQLEFLIGERKIFNIDEYDIHLIFTIPEDVFLTSDNPVYIRPVFIENENCGFVGRIWFPLSPNCMVSLSKKGNDTIGKDEYTVFFHVIKGNFIKELNQHICENANNIIISSKEITDLDFQFSKN